VTILRERHCRQNNTKIKQMCEDSNSEGAPPATKAEIELMKREIELLEKSHDRSIEFLKWGFGIFITLAAIFVSGNWLATRSNYDRDKDNLQQQSVSLQKSLDLSQKELALQNENLLDDMKRQIDANMAIITASNGVQLAEIHSEATSDIKNMVKARATDDENVLSNLNLAISNLYKSIDAIQAGQMKEVNSRLAENANANKSAISNLWLGLQLATSRDEAVSLSVKGDWSAPVEIWT
jgi:hypothetical protein